MGYLPVSPAVRKIVKRMRDKYYKKFAPAKIVIVMRTGRWGKWATIARVSDKQRLAGIDGDYLLTVNADAWVHLSTKQRYALIDHELFHMVVHTKDGEVKYRLRHHDVEEFNVIIKRHGNWCASLRKMYRTMQRRG